MNKTNIQLMIACIALLMVVCLLFLSGCASSSNEGDKFIMGGTYPS